MGAACARFAQIRGRQTAREFAPAGGPVRRAVDSGELAARPSYRVRVRGGGLAQADAACGARARRITSSCHGGAWIVTAARSWPAERRKSPLLAPSRNAR